MWFEHLTEDDVAFLAGLDPRIGAARADRRDDTERLGAVLADPVVFDMLFGEGQDETLLRASPFLAFAVVVHRGWVELQGASYVEEWVGARKRLPVLGGDDLRQFLAASERRLFLAELLASYSRVVSGSTWVHTRRGWQRRRFSELDPVRLASLLEVVPEGERPGVLRRLGDLALFLTGVFPDHTAQHGLGRLAEERLLRAGGLPLTEAEDLTGARPGGAVGLLEGLGRRWYRLAVRSAPFPETGGLPVVAQVGEQFGLARRTLNYLTDRYLFPIRHQWFGDPTAL